MRELNEWFEKNRRSFPWREGRTPYKVWISEVMLQQTRASVVTLYFERWMNLFPNVKALAEADIEKVIKAWEGLGYYSRARNLHRAARQIVEHFGEEVPDRREALETLAGLGPYTINAILSFGFQRRCAAVDGNVTRLLSRFFSVEENVSKAKVRDKLQRGAEVLLDSEEPWVTAEALIELGATICTPKPRCEACPLQKNCLGKEKAELLPIKNQKEKTIHLKRACLIIEADGKVLVKKTEEGLVMADLYEFPYFEMGEKIWTQRKIIEEIANRFDLHAEVIAKLPPITHTFTKYKAHLFPLRLKVGIVREIPNYKWIEKKLLSHHPFSSGHRKLLNALLAVKKSLV